MIFKPLLFTNWMEKYRPTGQGYMSISTFGNNEPPKVAQVIAVVDVICDFCNALIEKLDNKKQESIIWSDGGYSVCTPCFIKSEQEKNK